MAYFLIDFLLFRFLFLCYVEIGFVLHSFLRNVAAGGRSYCALGIKIEQVLFVLHSFLRNFAEK